MDKKNITAYFSMEIAVDNDIKTYAGGLGVLAGDILRSAAKINFPMVGVTLLNNEGYFKQVIKKNGSQIEKKDDNYDFKKLKKLDKEVFVDIKGEKVKVGVWVYFIKNVNNKNVPVYFLDTNFFENSKEYRKLTGQLYGNDLDYRLKQEIILGRGGVKMLKLLGYKDIKKIHLNEGHGALACVELFLDSKEKSNYKKIKEVRRKCVFTTHTPLPRAQDIFSLVFLKKYQLDFPDYLPNIIKNGEINMALLAFYFCGKANAVSLKHREVSRKIFPGVKIKAITNGVNADFWSSEEFKKIYNKYIPSWQNSAIFLKEAIKIPLEEIYLAHENNKKNLFKFIAKKTDEELKTNIFTIGFARRFTAYKRPEFLFTNLDELLKINKEIGEIQIIYAGKAHPGDLDGKGLIKDIIELKKILNSKIKIVFLENYDLNTAKLITSGVDLWLNTPLPPNEASGTSGMKAALNGVPQLSTFDGWWCEGYKKNKTGWLIKEKKKNSLYKVLEKDILPMFYNNKTEWKKIMRNAIYINGAYFNTDRVLKEYIKKMY